MNKIKSSSDISHTDVAFSSAALRYCLLVLLLLCGVCGCFRRKDDPFAPRRPIAERICQRRHKDVVEETVLSQTELVLQADSHIKSLTMAENSKRLLLERSLTTEDYTFDYSESFSTVKALAEESPNAYGVELWNIEFADARLESFTNDQVGLLESTQGCAAFDEKGERLFWVDREEDDRPLKQASALMPNVDGKHYEGFSNYVSANEDFVIGAADPNSAYDRISGCDLDSSNSILTKLLESHSYNSGEDESVSAEIDVVKHMKTADDAKFAECVWLSPKARWIVCRKAMQYFLDETSENNEDAAKVNKEWTLVLLRDRKRVVHFPESVKMTFDNSTSDENIEGKIVDVLDVSDEGDLVATLIEEQIPLEEAYSDGNTETSTAPRYKIVVWDLNVAKTVDYEKAKKPLMALEVSQMTVAVPVPRKFCKFSPTGDRFAARIEPRYITIWQSGNGRMSMELGEHRDVIQDFTFSPHSAKMVVVVGGKYAQIVLWEIRKGVVHRTLEDVVSRPTSIDAVTFSPDENYVYFANNLGEVKRWNIRMR